MSETSHENDSRPLLPSTFQNNAVSFRQRPGRNAGLSGWLASLWPRFSNGYQSVSNRERDPDSPVAPRDDEGTSDPGPSVTTPCLPTATSSEAASRPEYEIMDLSEEASIRREAIIRLSSQSSGNSQEKLCLICLEPLSNEDFENGEAITLACQCRGDAALRHKNCAQKWVDIKGDLICDVCRAPITNLEAPRPRSDAGSHRLSDDFTDASRGRHPSASDVFDCIRMTWIVTIVCILFFGSNIAVALITGLIIAVLYTWTCQLMRCAQSQQEQAAQRQPQEAVVIAEPQMRMPAIVIV